MDNLVRAPWHNDEPLGDYLDRAGVSRRQFLAYCGELAALLGLSSMMVPEVAEALQASRRPSVIWLQFQSCTGCVESLLRTESPTMGDLVLQTISLDYNRTIQAAAGSNALAALRQAAEENWGSYLLAVEGSIPTKDGGVYDCSGGITARQELEEFAEGAAAVISVGACAFWGGWPAANPNPTGAVGVSALVRDKPLVAIPGCPPIGDVITATVAHYLTFGRLPELDLQRRPMFAYGARIHDQCPRRAHYNAGQYVEAFDDEAARRGWCLYKMGCKGPETYSPCPLIAWNGTTKWPIAAGHPCFGCTEPFFWDTMTPIYDRLPAVSGFGVERTADTIGAAIAAGVTAGVAIHAVATGIQRARQSRVTEQYEEKAADKSEG
jgi:hydrogenase small subunit